MCLHMCLHMIRVIVLTASKLGQSPKRLGRFHQCVRISIPSIQKRLVSARLANVLSFLSFPAPPEPVLVR